MIFNVNSTLLADSPINIENNFEITVPVSLEKAGTNNFQRFKKSIDSNRSAYLKLSPLEVFYGENGYSVIVSKINTDTSAFKLLDGQYKESLISNFATNNIHESKIKINGIKTVQFIITNSHNVIFNLICEINEDYYQVDYIIPTLVYKEKLRDIESSIGSLTLIKKGK